MVAHVVSFLASEFIYPQYVRKEKTTVCIQLSEKH